MIHKKFVNGYLQFLKEHYPAPKSVRVDINFHVPENFPEFPGNDPKYMEGACWRHPDNHYRVEVKISKRRHTTCFRLGHEYKHVLQFCYEGMKSSDKDLKGLGYHYRQWEIPANHFANETIAAYKSTLK